MQLEHTAQLKSAPGKVMDSRSTLSVGHAAALQAAEPQVLDTDARVEMIHSADLTAAPASTLSVSARLEFDHKADLVWWIYPETPEGEPDVLYIRQAHILTDNGYILEVR